MLTTVTAVKDWGEVPEDWQEPVTVTLMYDGAPLGGVNSAYTQVLCAENNWTYVWEGLPLFLDGEVADYALKDRDDVINLFITAPLENRIKRVAARNGISENEAKDRIKKTDKSRASYYNYYSAKDWGDAKSYDLCIDSSLLGIDGTVELLKDLIRIKDIK